MNKEQLSYLKKIYKGRSNKEITNLINEKFGTTYSVHAIEVIKSRNNLKSGYGRFVASNPECLKFLKENVKGRSNKDLTKLFNEKFKTNFTVSQIARHKTYYHLTNDIDTRYKKGNISQSKKNIGSETVYKNGVVFIKIAEPNTWIRKNRYIYEQYYGKLPKGYNVIHLNGNKKDCRIENLKAVKIKDCLVMKNLHLYSNNPEITETGTLIAEVINKRAELITKKKGERNGKDKGNV